MLYLTIGSIMEQLMIWLIFNEIGVLCLLADQSSEYILTPHNTERDPLCQPSQ